MRVSTNTRNAVNCIIDLAMHGGELVSLPSIANRQAVSIAYLEQTFAKLRRAGLIHAVRGRGGGYSLAREAMSISVADVLYAVEGKVDATGCSGRENCKRGSKCLSHHVWVELNNQIHEHLQKISLDELITYTKVPSTEIEQLALLDTSASDSKGVAHEFH